MKKLYEKSELGFALLWIGLYVVLLSLADGLSAKLGTEKLITAPLCLLMTALLAGWVWKNGLAGKYGLAKVRMDWKRYLYFLPLLLVVSTNLWSGVSMHYSVGESLLYVLSMLCVGFLEELIFRGFLFLALRRDNEKMAIAISSITFGLGHIVNLLNGAAFADTVMQIVYAVAIGYLFTVLFLKSGSLWPCIAAHSLVNSLSAFSGPRSPGLDVAAAVFLTVLPGVYALWIQKKDREDRQKTDA